MSERRRVDFSFEYVMQCFRSVAHAEMPPELPEPSRAEATTVRERDHLVLQPRDDLPDAIPVARVAGVVAAIALDDPAIRVRVNVVDAGPNGRQATAHERFP